MNEYRPRTVVLSSEKCAELSSLLHNLLSDGSTSPAISVNPPMIVAALLFEQTDFSKLQYGIENADGKIAVHETQSFKRFEQLPMNEALQLHLSETPKSSADTREFEARIRLNNDLTAMMLRTRLRWLDLSEFQMIKPIEFQKRSVGDQAVILTLRPIGAMDIATYLDLSHDTNPIHINEKYARSLGLAGIVVPGMLITGLVEFAAQALMSDAKIERMSIRFMNVVSAGQSLTIILDVKTHQATDASIFVRAWVLGHERRLCAVVEMFFGVQKSKN